MTTRWIRLVDCYYATETDGYQQKTPVLHLFGRDTDWNRHHLQIDQYRPYFLTRQSEWRDIGDELAADERVLSVETTDHRGRIERAIDGEQLLRVIVREPGDVKALRSLVDDPFEADVLFPTRFLIDMADTQWIQVSEDALHSNEPLSLQDIHLPDYSEGKTSPPDDIPPIRYCLYDIEVKQGGVGPPVVSKEGTERASNDITAITAYDSYTMEYESWVLIHSEWDRDDVEAIRVVPEGVDVPLNVHVYENPHDVVAQFCQWVIERAFDGMVAWNGAGFDHPYLVNYGLKNGVSAIKELSPTYQTYEMDGDGSFINSSLKGRLLLDLMVLYKKCNIHSLESYRLADVAEAEGVSVGKLDLESEIDVPTGEPAIDYAWRAYPETFVEYSLRDVQACVGINRESQSNVTII